VPTIATHSEACISATALGIGERTVDDRIHGVSADTDHGCRQVSRKGISKMVEEVGKPPPDPWRSDVWLKKPGSPKRKSQEIIGLLGPHNWPSLLRESRMLKKP
jgi:hypothetical protein